MFFLNQIFIFFLIVNLFFKNYFHFPFYFVFILNKKELAETNIKKYSGKIKKLEKLTYAGSTSLNSEINKENIYEKLFKAYGLVDVWEYDTSIVVDLRYSTKNNVFKTNFYNGLKKAYLQEDVVKKLVKASKILKFYCKECRLVILDAARPLSVQKKMWEKLNVPNKEKFLNSPLVYSLHNFGAAIDVTILKGNEYLDMGSDFDEFSERSFTFNEDYLLNAKKLNFEQYSNRKLLRKVMVMAGFYSIGTEWWHFNSCSRYFALKNYKLINDLKIKYNSLFFYDNENFHFKIQILKSTKKQNLNLKLKGNIKLYIQYCEDIYTYYVGNFKSLDEANFYLKELKNIGFKDAHIVPFYKELKINFSSFYE